MQFCPEYQQRYPAQCLFKDFRWTHRPVLLSLKAVSIRIIVLSLIVFNFYNCSL